MKLFADLIANQAVKVGSAFVVNLPRGDYLSPSGNRVTVGGFDNQFSIDSVEGWKKIIKSPKTILEFILEDGSKVPYEDYRKVLERHSSYYDDNLEEFVYPDLETEFEIKKEFEVFNRAEKVYSEPTESHEPVNIQVVGAAKDSGSEFINSPIQYGRVHWNSGVGIWKVDCGKIARDAFEKATYEITDKELPTHSNITYAKVKGKFAFINDERRYDWVKNPASVFITDSFEEACQKEEFIRKYVTNRVGMFLSKVTEQTAQDIWQSLKQIRSRITDIDAKQKSAGSKHASLKAVDELMVKLENAK